MTSTNLAPRFQPQHFAFAHGRRTFAPQAQTHKPRPQVRLKCIINTPFTPTQTPLRHLSLSLHGRRRSHHLQGPFSANAHVQSNPAPRLTTKPYPQRKPHSSSPSTLTTKGNYTPPQQLHTPRSVPATSRPQALPHVPWPHAKPAQLSAHD